MNKLLKVFDPVTINNNFDEKIPERSLSESDLSTNFHKIVLK